MVSITLHSVMVRENGRYEEGRRGFLLAFGIGMTSACFHIVGISPVVQIWLMRSMAMCFMFVGSFW